MNHRLTKTALAHCVALEAKLDAVLFADRDEDRKRNISVPSVVAGVGGAVGGNALRKDFRNYTAAARERSARLNTRAAMAAADPKRAAAAAGLRQAAARPMGREVAGYAKDRLGKLANLFPKAATPAKAAAGSGLMLTDAAKAAKDVLSTAGRKAKRAILR